MIGEDEMQTYDRANVLLVDDQPAKLLSYQVILSGIDANLIAANSAREALDWLLKAEVAVVIVDVCMPELDGFELARMIREHPRFSQTAIIFVSGIALTELDRLRGYKCGAVDYLPVPIVPEILQAKVSAFVELHRKTHELELLNRDLERRVAERTAALEEAGQRKDEFLAVLAHELRNPLAAIRTAAQVVGRSDAAQAAVAQAAGMIERQVAHLRRLVDDLVDVSRITRGIIELKHDRIKIRDVVFHAIETSQSLIAERRHTLALSPVDESLELFGDAARLTQVVANVLHNSAKFTPVGGVIDLSVDRRADVVAIQVKDNGAGITPDALPHIFDLFSRTDRGVQCASPGLGVGLALVRRLVTMHHGEVIALSDGEGKGAEVTIRLPLALAAEDLATVDVLADQPVSNASRRILVVDDNSDAAEALALLLRLSGHMVETAFDGLEALRVAPGFSPEVVLLDIGMPRLDGYNTARSIRAESWGKHIVLVALTGWGQPKDHDRSLQAGFDAHLVKPVSTEELMRVIQTDPRSLDPKDCD
jgi:signal transduction histidine kinase